MLSSISRFLVLRQLLATWLIVWMSLPSMVIWANPGGGTVSSGSANISGGPGNLTINQSSQRAIIKWNDFSINQGEKTTFVQPNSQSATLNRVTGGSASQLNGTLNANGKVYLVNPNGVVIGKTGRINTSSFTASTHDVSDAEFLGGGDMTFRGTSKAGVVNHGKIKATDGDVTLIARQVENTGKIRAKNGSVNLAGGTEVLVKPSGEQRVYIKSNASSGGGGSVSNSGSIRATAAELRAAGGNEYALAVNNSGVIRATTVDKSGGRIVLRAESGITRNSGSLIATSKAPGKNGGRIDVTGEKVLVSKTAKIDASSKYAKGGTVNIGGGFQGKDGAVKNATVTVVEKGATVKADGGTQGGTAVVWSDEATGMYGDISVRGNTSGGGASGTGGFVEVSSKGYLDFRGGVETGGGILLLDPSNITISADPDNALSTGLVGTDTSISSTAADSILNTSTLTTLLASNNVIVSTSGIYNSMGGLRPAVSGDNASGDIAIEAPVSWNSVYSLTLLAQDDIFAMNAVVNLGTGSLNLVAGWNGATITSDAASLVTAENYGFNGTLPNDNGAGGVVFVSNDGGSVYVGGQSGQSGTVILVSNNGDTLVAGYDVVVRGSPTSTGIWSIIGSDTTPSHQGDIYVYSKHDVIVAADPILGYSAAKIGHVMSAAGASQSIGGNILVQAGNSVQVLAGKDSFAQIGHGASSINTTLYGNITVTAAGDINVRGGTGANANAQIGHGNSTYWPAGSYASISGNVSVTSTSGAINVLAGSGNNDYALVGHGGNSLSANTLSGTVTLSSGGNLTVQGGTGKGAWAQIGHGGLESNIGTSTTGNIFITSTGDINLVGGTRVDTYVQIGLGGSRSTQGLSDGVISIWTPYELNMTSGNADFAYAQIGHGGIESTADSLEGSMRVNATDVVLQGKNKGESAYVQIGHGGGYGDSSGVTVNNRIAGEITFGSSTRSLLMTAGKGPYAYAMIGHGGDSITVTNEIMGGITLHASQNFQIKSGNGTGNFAMVGNGGASAYAGGFVYGDISLTGGSIVTLDAGNGEGSFVQIGHIGDSSRIDSFVQGNITISGLSIALLGGNGIDTYATIGHGGLSADSGTITNNISVTFGTLIVQGGKGLNSIAQIGNGFGVNIGGCGCGGPGGIFGTIDVTGTGVLSITGGRGDGSYAMIGNGSGGTIVSEISGNINVSASTIAIVAGDHDGLSFAKIGHDLSSPFSIVPGSLSGDINVNYGQNLVMIAGTDLGGAFVQIGHGGIGIIPFLPAITSIEGDITVAGNAGSSIVMTAGNGCPCYTANYAIIGHGGLALVNGFDFLTFTSHPSFIRGDISVTGGSLYMQGGTYAGSFVQIGHTNSRVDNSSLPFDLVDAPLTGNIAINLDGDLTMAAGTRRNTYALIGHGRVPANDAGGERSGQIVVMVGGETSLVSGTRPGADYWIGHRTDNRDLITNSDILFRTGTLDYNALSTSDTTTINERFAQIIGGNYRRGNFTLVSTNTEGGLVVDVADPFGDRGSSYTLSLLSSGNLYIGAPLAGSGSTGSLFLAAGFDGTSGILGITGSPLVETSKFTAASSGLYDVEIDGNLTFGKDISIVAGRSILIGFDTTLTAGGHFQALTDNFNAARPEYGATSYFYNLGHIRAGTASLFAVDPTQVILGDFASLDGELRDIWFGDADAILGANYKLTLAPPPPPDPPGPTPDPTTPTLSTSDNPDDRLRKAKQLSTNQRFSIFYAQSAGLTSARRARLWLSSFNVVPGSSYEVSAQGR
ncbi:MAG TPA: filamentous hemagglutinin N-terminal domain-containing protein [Candidatus Methylacidiphilales bacterium]|nr:filamentous hemagglutinin N-terminal domain-containing protein [Candidatus Methylacidiphilales bacterium]